MNDNSRIEKYQEAIKYFENDIKKSNNKTYITWAKEMINVYQNIINKENLIDNNIKKNDDLGNYIVNNIYSNENIKEKFILLEQEIIEVLKDSNEDKIDDWFIKFNNFISDNKLDRDYMFDYVNGIFNLYDKNHLYIDSLKDLYNGKKVSDINDNKKIDEIENEVQDKQDSLSYDNYEEYVENMIVNNSNQNLKNELNRLTTYLESINMPNDVMVETFFKNYKNFVESNNLNEKFMLEYITEYMGSLDKDNSYELYITDLYNGKTMAEIKNKSNTIDSNTIDNSVDNNKKDNDSKKDDDLNTPENELEEELGNEPIKIVSTKKTVMGKSPKIILTALALSAIFNPVTALANASFALFNGTAIGYGLYKAYKNRKYRKEELANLLRKFDVDLNSDGKLIDKEGNVITEERVGRERYEEIRSSLKKIGALENKLINPSYVKNKLTSMYLNNGLVRKVKSKQQEKKEQKDYINKQDTYLGKVEAEKELKMGMGRF